MNSLSNMKNLLFSLIAVTFLASCGSLPKMQPVANEQEPVDYANLENWAAHLDLQDASDLVPKSNSASPSVDINDLEVDIFFVHPTTYTGKAKDGSRNATIHDEKINKQTDKSTIQYQASIFNQVGRVYAPRYRQAHISSFYSKDPEQGRKALQLAYEDVVDAFEYYNSNLREGRPFIIASHSQGTVHASRLIRELIDGHSIQKDFILAYLIGMPIEKGVFQNIPVCNNSKQTNCFVTWRTYQEGYTPEYSSVGESIAVVNPLSWNTSKSKIGKEQHQGAILRNFNKPLANIIDTRIHNGMLWTNKPKFPWSFLFKRKDYHIVDMNFFYYDIQHNAQNRVKQFLANRQEEGKY